MLSVLPFPAWLRIVVAFLFVFISCNAFAEDVEVFSVKNFTSEPNILVVLDNSGSMTLEVEGSADSRMVALTKAFKAFTSNPEIQDINIGLMAFSNGNFSPRPHGVSVPILPIDDEILPVMMSNLVPAYLSTGDNFGFFDLGMDNLPDPVVGQTVREYLPEVIGDWEAEGGTPIVDSLHEAALYFKGMSPKWGSVSAEQVNAAHPSSYSGQITATIQRMFTGETDVCILPDCGLNCRPTQTESECAVGETSCWTGTGCFTETKGVNYKCELGSKLACEALDSRYSCSEKTKTNCSTTCNGEKDPESGVCLGTETKSCSSNTYHDCAYQAEVRSCLRDKYECDVYKETKINSGSATYISPITQECQSHTIILMSDGGPNAASQEEAIETQNEIKSLLGRAVDCAPVYGQTVPNTEFNTLGDGRCGPELAKHLSTVDQSASVDGDNFIKTYTVGFAVDDRPEAGAYLKSLAANGGGKYFSANDSDALAEAFIAITQDVSEPARSFAAPVYTVDPASMLSHSDDVYLPLFKNSDLPAWSGNLKKFKLNTNGKIVDANGVVAFDRFGQLKADAVDFWMPTGAADGVDPIISGGFANNVNPGSRKLLTDSGNTLVSLNDGNVSKAQLGDASMSDAKKTTLLDYITGYEVDGVTARNAIGDILHSKPTLISYGNTKQVLYFGTNEGFLHAVDAADASDGGGVEQFAFMPSNLLDNVEGMSSNKILPAGGLSRIYGVDGSITAFLSDKNLNGKIDVADGDTATLIFGLRRGGHEYYALDVTDPEAPSLKWKSVAFGDFSDMGESWSKPIPTRLRYLKGGNVTWADVLVFGGGYDNRLDEESRASRSALSATKGNGVYIVDLDTGDLIWSYTGGKLEHSVPSNIRALDIDGDGSVERLYFGDTGGNLWRVDLNAYDSEPGRKLFDVANNSQLTHLASLGGTGSDYRKFFFAPDVAIFKEGGKERLVMSIGSGYRAHPLNDAIDDRLYVLSDEDVRNVPEKNKAPLTDVDFVSPRTLGGESFLTNHRGWYKPLINGTGEKVLSSPITFMKKIAFTTFSINNAASSRIDDSGCVVHTPNQSSAYVLDLTTGLATVDLDGDGVIDANDESVVVPSGDILETPQLYFNKPSNCTTEGCDHIVDIRVDKKTMPLVDGGTAGGNTNVGDYVPKVFWVNE